jgi:ABC-type lipoprotein release transport system permease subunit
VTANALYAVLAYIVAERTRELGLRMAFGASRSDILGMVLWRALDLALLGILAGASASLLGTKLLAGFLFRVQPLDPSTFVTVTLTLLSVAILAALAPAIRAASVNPMQILREHYNRSHKPSRSMVACSLPDIESRTWTLFKRSGSTEVFSCAFASRGYALH